MRNVFLLVIVPLFLLLACATSVTGATGVSGRARTLDQAAKTAAEEIQQTAAIRGTFAVAVVHAPSDELSAQITRKLENNLLANKKISLLSRQKIQSVLAEQDFGVSGYVDDETAPRIGHLLGAKFILTAELSGPGGTQYLHIQVLETESGALAYSNSFAIKTSEVKNHTKPQPQKQQAFRF